jgi:hypothetical protein
MSTEQIYVGPGAAASDVRSGSAAMSLGELRRLEGLSPFAKKFLEVNASLPDAWMVVITNGHFALREPR